MSLYRHVCASAGGLLLVALPVFAATAQAPAPTSAAARLVAHLIASPPATPRAVEQAIGVKLRVIADNAGWRSFAGAGRARPMTIKADYRMPRGARGAGDGALLVVDLGGGCPSLAALRKRFGPMRAGAPPSPHARNGAGHFDRAYRWGRVSLGYRFLTPDCLSSIVVQMGG